MKLLLINLCLLLFFAASERLDAESRKNKALRAGPTQKTLKEKTGAGLTDGNDPKQSLFLLDTVHRTLRHQPSILIQKEKVSESRGGVKIADGAFDWKMGAMGEYSRDSNSSYHYPYSGYHATVTPQVNLNVKKAVPFGPSVEAGLSMKRQEYRQSYFDHYVNLSSGSYYQTSNKGRLDFKLNVPILPLVGDKNYAADRKALELQHRASVYDLQAKISEAVYKTVAAYWDFVFAFRQREILREAMERARTILENTEDLAAGGEVPRIEIENARGNLADKINSCTNAEQVLIESKSVLAQAIGISLEDLDGRNFPADMFPDIRREGMPDLLKLGASYGELAMQNRKELRSLSELLESADAYVVSARNHVLPDLNFQLGVGYDGLRKGDSADAFFGAAKRNQPGMDLFARIIFEYPLGNYEARGRLEKTVSQLRQLKHQQVQLRHTIRTNVQVSLYALTNALDELQKSEDSVKIYENAYRGERDKFRAGETTLLNIIDIQNRHDNVLLNNLSVRKKTALAILRLRYETGTLVLFNNTDGTVAMKELVTVPLVP